MMHTVKINDNTPTGKRVINDLRKYTKTVKFVNPIANGTVPEGYMTGDEFFGGIKKELKKRCLENGLL